jgi:hypothetical protein
MRQAVLDGLEHEGPPLRGGIERGDGASHAQRVDLRGQPVEQAISDGVLVGVKGSGAANAQVGVNQVQLVGRQG